MKKTVLFASLVFNFNLMANLSNNINLTSDYVWRGLTQTNHDPAVQGGIDYDHSSGLSTGTWTSNISNSGVEVDLYLKYTLSLSESFSVFANSTHYHFTKNGKNSTTEYTLGVKYRRFSLSSNYTDDYFGTDTASWHHRISSKVKLLPSHKLNLYLAIGYTTFDNENKSASTNYTDYKVSLDRTLSDFTVSLFYTNTDREDVLNNIETQAEDHSYGVGISREF
jgi:uncharacterized protein (TIGR02001 family)